MEVKSPAKILLVVVAVVVSFVVVTSFASAGSRQNVGTILKGGVHNGVITACIEPLRKNDIATSFDLKFKCLRNYRTISWNIRGPRGPRGVRGPAGNFGLRGPTGPAGPLARQVPLARPVPRETLGLRALLARLGPRGTRDRRDPLALQPRLLSTAW